ncbi:hypothetical protein V1509DRAFT_655214 [Lipomyces kononenkoae]
MQAGTLVVRHMDPATAGFHQPPKSVNPASQHMRKARQDIPPAVAALLAVTAIPPPKSGSRNGRRRKSSVKDGSSEIPQKSSRKPSLQVSKSPNAHEGDDAGTNSDTISVRPKTSRKSSSLSSASSQSSSSRRKVARQKQRTYPSELVELLTPPPVDADSESDSEDATSLRSLSNGYRLHEVKRGRDTSATSPTPPLSRSVSSTDSSPRVSPTTPFSSQTEYFPIVNEEDSDSDTDTFKSSFTDSAAQVESATATISRSRKHQSASITMYNDDPLCVALDESIPAMTFIPPHMKPGSFTRNSIPDRNRVGSAKYARTPPRRKSQQELLDEEYAREHSSMVAKINMSLRSLNWVATSMARHQEEYLSKDEIDHLEQHQPYRNLDRHASKPMARSASSGLSATSAKSRSSSSGRKQRSESVPARTDKSGKEIRYRSLSAGGVTPRSSARALTIQVPISEKQTISGESDGEQVDELPSIQMKTYDIQQNCLPIFRPREPRMNGDFWRIFAMELQMRRNGKLSHDFYSGKARMVLAPRADYGHLEKKPRSWTAWNA